MRVSSTLRRALFLVFLPLLLSPLQCRGVDISTDELTEIIDVLTKKSTSMVLGEKVKFEGFNGFPSGMTPVEKVRLTQQLLGQSFLEHLKKHSNESQDILLKAFLKELKSGKQLDIKSLSAKSVSTFLAKVAEKKRKDVFDPSKCRAALDEGDLPEARLGHSPISTFGYPMYDPKTQTHYFDRKTSLNTVNGFPVPIKLGVYDYSIIGTPDQIKSFLKCFADYEVIGSTLGQDGHWHNDPETADVPVLPVSVQVQGVMKTGSIASLLTRRTVSSILQRVGPDVLDHKYLVDLLKAHFAGEEVAIEKLVTQNKGLRRVLAVVELLGHKSEKTRTFLEELKLATTVGEKVKVLTKYVNAYLSALNPTHGQWVGGENVRLSRKVSLTLTVYPRPNNDVRATRVMDSNIVTLGDVLNVFEEIVFKN